MTEKDQLILDFIKAYIRLHGVAPSYSVIARGVHKQSKSNIHRVVHKLMAEGKLVMKPHKARSIRVIDKSVRAVAML
jgi:SOS-response transcriptional repressor LexA